MDGANKTRRAWLRPKCRPARPQSGWLLGRGTTDNILPSARRLIAYKCNSNTIAPLFRHPIFLPSILSMARQGCILRSRRYDAWSCLLRYSEAITVLDQGSLLLSFMEWYGNAPIEKWCSTGATTVVHPSSEVYDGWTASCCDLNVRQT